MSTTHYPVERLFAPSRGPSIWRRYRVLALALLFAIALCPVKPALGLGIDVGKPAPAFELSGLDGNRYRLNEPHNQKTRLLFFFDPTSAACRNTLKDLITLVEDSRSGQLDVWAIARASKAQITSFVQSINPPFPILLDPGNISKTYQAQLILPMIYVLDPQLTIRGKFIGGGPSITAQISRILKRDATASNASSKFDTYWKRGIRAFNAKRFADAERYLLQALSIRADKGAYVYLVYSQKQLGKKRLLNQTLQEAITRFPKETRFYKIYAKWLIENERLDDAVEVVDTALKIAPNDMELLSLKDYLHKADQASTSVEDRNPHSR